MSDASLKLSEITRELAQIFHFQFNLRTTKLNGRAMITIQMSFCYHLQSNGNDVKTI